jgi:hypothetical protein
VSELARFFATFDPDEDIDIVQPDSPVELRLRSAPWDDVLDDDLSSITSTTSDEEPLPEDDQSLAEFVGYA